MDQKPTVDSKTHFHIRWFGVAKLDWEPFRAREQAQARATELSNPGEAWTLEECDETCLRCGSKAASAS